MGLPKEIHLDIHPLRILLVDDDEDCYVITRALGQLEGELKEGFMRVHKTNLVNLQHVRSYERGEGGRVIMSNGKSIDVSRDKKQDLMKALGLT